MTRSERLALAGAQLAKAKIPSAMRDAHHLMAHILGVTFEELLRDRDTPFPEKFEPPLCLALEARQAYQPIAQITGQRLFWGRSFQITPEVLDPRPETECLIEAALERSFNTVLDLGTGSGAILLTLLAERPNAHGLGVDISPAALSVASQNAKNLSIAEQANFQESNWFDNVTGRFDLIVANPPYITPQEMQHLPREVYEWEPHIALLGPGNDGLEAYRTIIAQAHKYAAPDARLIFEMGPSQGPDIVALMQKAGLKNIECLRDFDGRERIARACF